MFSVIHHDRSAGRFDTRVEGFECVLDYTLASGVMTITHTAVPAAVGGRGIASGLMQAAMDAARAEHWKVSPDCSYAGAWLKRHAAYHDMRI